jgi:hypothetical protein
MGGPGLLALPALLLALPVAAPAGDADFKALVQGIETRYNVKPMRIPLFGLAKFFIEASRPHGVRQFAMAIFEDARFGQPDEREFDEFVRRAVSENWRPMVRVRSRSSNEWTCVYAKEAGRDIRMIVATFEPNEAVVMHYKVSARRLMDMLARPERIGRGGK